MEIISLLQLLERRRRFVAVGLVIALLAGAAVAGIVPGASGIAPSPPTGLAQARLLLDTPEPLAADLDARADAIGAQSALVADLLASDAQLRRIAQGAGIPADALVVRRRTLTMPAVPSRLAERAAAAGVPAHPYAIDVRVSAALPILSIDAFGPDVESATALAESTTRALKGLVSRGGGGLGLKTLEPVSAIAVPGVAARDKLFGVVAAIAVFVLWCAAIVALAGLERARASRRGLPGMVA